MKIINILIVSALILSSNLRAQNEITPLEELTSLLEIPINDAIIVMEGYIEPLGKSIGLGLNSGWYNTGKPHRFPGFDINFGVSIMTFPDIAKTFSAELSSGKTEELSTIIGPEASDTISYSLLGLSQYNILAPPGINIKHLGIPYLQGSIGLIYDTEILFRYFPPITYNNMTANYWGIGIKHDIKQHIPVLQAINQSYRLPFDLSILTAYSHFKSSYENNEDGFVDFDIQAFNCNIILSKKFSVLTTYAGFGYQHSIANLLFGGMWDYRDQDLSIITQENPINLSIGGVNGLKANIGARIKLLLFTIHADYTFAEYNMFTVGVGLNSDLGSKIIGGGIEKATKKNRD